MKPPAPHRFAAALCALALLLPTARARGEGLASGSVQFSAEIAAACLDGAYPCTIGTHDGGVLAVTTDARGRLTGTLDLRGIVAPVTGRITATRKAIRLTLRGSMGKQRFKIRGELKGAAFVGKATSKGHSVGFTLDASTVGKLVVSYDLTLAVDGAGRIAGTGMASACGVQIPVAAAGRNRNKSTKLRVTGAKTLWMGTGPPTATGFTAKWSARGFGAKVTGKDLDITPTS